MRRKTYLACTIASLLFLLTGITSVHASTLVSEPSATGPGRFLEEDSQRKQDIQTTLSDDSLKNADHVFLVFPSETASQLHHADFYWYSSENGIWKEIEMVKATYGRNGVTSEKQEGDGKTPSGTFSFTMAYGIKEDPGALLPYHLVQQGDVWVDDPQSIYYNQLINRYVTPDGWTSGEVLENYVPDYHYGLVLDHNEECIPYKGSAIFLHCINDYDTGSSGCICVPEELMKEIVTKATDSSKIVIIPSKQESFPQNQSIT